MRTLFGMCAILFISLGGWRCSCECVGCCPRDGEKICRDPIWVSKRECREMDQTNDPDSKLDEGCWFECAN